MATYRSHPISEVLTGPRRSAIGLAQACELLQLDAITTGFGLWPIFHTSGRLSDMSDCDSFAQWAIGRSIMAVIRFFRNGSRQVAAVVCLLLLVLMIAAYSLPPGIDERRIWTIGTDNTLPYHALVDVPGVGLVPKGIAGELVAAAAQRAGVKLAWQVVQVSAVSEGKVDLWPLNSVSGGNTNLRVTRPLLRHSYVVVSTSRDVENQRSWATAKRVLVRGGWLRAIVAPLFPRAQLVGILDRGEALSELCNGKADLFLVEARPLQALMLNRPSTCLDVHFYLSGVDVSPIELGIGSTVEAAPVAERLRDEIDAMVDDGTVTLLLKDWAFYSSGEVDLIYREATARRAKGLSMILVAVLALLAGTMLILFLRLRIASRKALAADAAKSAFLANMSHEIRTPLNGILGLAEVLSRSSLAPEQKDLLAMIRSSGTNLLCIANDVLDLARISRGEFEVQLEVFDPGELIENTLKPFGVEAREKGLEFLIGGTQDLPRGLLGDPARLRQILINLVGNAIKFTKQGQVSICVSARTEHFAGNAESMLHLAIEDTGIGIAEDARARLFEKFYQADTSISRRFGGTGLGLSIVKELIRVMNGSISFESELGRGSRFQIVIPIPLVPVGPVLESKLLNAVQEDFELRKERILLVEDNAVNQIVAKSSLEMAGYVVVIADNGVKGVAAWKSGDFDAILMDCQMPEMDGYQATAEIRRCEAGKLRVPIIALTASAMVGARDKCLEAGMDDFLSKPIQAADLQRILEKWLGTRGAERAGLSTVLRN